MSKRVALLLIPILALTSLIVIESVFAQSTTKPSVPEFTVKYVDSSHDVPPRYDFDPYTGENVVVEPGYHVQEKTIEVVIENQPFTSYEDANGNVIRLYYSIRIKGSFGDSWWYPDYSDYTQVDAEGERVNYAGADVGSDFTVIAYGLVGNNGTRALLNLDISDGGKADFQVQAFIGYKTRVNDTYVPGIPVGDPTDPIPHHYVFTGETSNWSSTQTITIDEGQTATPSPATTPTPPPTSSPSPTPYSGARLPEQEIMIGVAIAAVVIGAGISLLVYFKRRKR
jgi:hypothetical protein